MVVDGELETSREESDYGSTFNNLHCRNCQEWLGRQYRTTTAELDHLRGNYTFSLGQLILYAASGSVCIHLQLSLVI